MREIEAKTGCGVFPASIDEVMEQALAATESIAPELFVLCQRLLAEYERYDKFHNNPVKLLPHVRRVAAGLWLLDIELGCPETEITEDFTLALAHDLGKCQHGIFSTTAVFGQGFRLLNSRKHCCDGARAFEKLSQDLNLRPGLLDFFQKGILHHHTPFDFLPRYEAEYHPRDTSRDQLTDYRLTMAQRIAKLTGVDFVLATGEKRQNNGELRSHADSIQMWAIYNVFEPVDFVKYPDLFPELRWLRFDLIPVISDYRKKLATVLDCSLDLDFFRPARIAVFPEQRSLMVLRAAAG